MTADQAFWWNLFPPPESDAAAMPIRMQSLKKNGHPLLLLPAQKPAAATTLSLYPAQTAKARLLRNGLQKLTRFGVPVGVTVELTPSKRDGFVHFLSGLAGVSDPQGLTFGVLAGNPASPSQRFMILVFNPQQQPVAVVKTGLHREARTLVARESEFLQRAPSNLPGLPRRIGGFQNDRLDALALAFYPGDSPKPSAHDRVAELLSAWVIPTESARLEEMAEWRALEGSVSTDVRAAAGCDLISNHMVHPCLYHGDFAPWNIKSHNIGEWTVLDWERGQARGIPAWDWFHYYLQSAILVEKLEGFKLLARAQEILNSSALQKYARAARIEGIERRLMTAYLLYTAEVIKPSEGREKTDWLWRALS